MLSFDSRAAQDRIERLPWVERASIERVLPDRLEVRVSERSPVAVWRLGDRNFLIDKSGRILGGRSRGRDAVAAARGRRRRRHGGGPALSTLLAGHPALMARVELAERVGGRRWMLRLADGGTVQLPAARRSARRLARALRVAGARGPEVSEIDVRVPERTLVRAAGGRKENVEAGSAEGDRRHLGRAWRKRWSVSREYESGIEQACR